jgi:hypothetical protein
MLALPLSLMRFPAWGGMLYRKGTASILLAQAGMLPVCRSQKRNKKVSLPLTYRSVF